MKLVVNTLLTGGSGQRANAVLLFLALAYFLLEWLPSLFGQYGYFIDEFYYVACSSHPAFGYVDHPPLSIFLLWLVRTVIGDSLPALRLVPSLAGAGTILITGLIARRLGANVFGQALAAGAAMVGAIYQVMFSYYSMNALSLLLWATCFYVLVEIERRDEPRLWLLIGVLAGLGLENKHTFILFVTGLAVGLLATKARRHLASRWFWLGCAIAALLVLPNMAWQATHGWPSLEFYYNADFYKNVPTPPLEVLKQQVLFMNPFAIFVWLAGLIFFLFTNRGRPYRHLGWVYIMLLTLMLIGQKSRPDRIAEAYSILFAGGGVLLGETLMRKPLRAIRWAFPILLLISGAAMAPLALPLLPPQATAEYAAQAGIVPQIERGEGKRSELPQWLADRLDWGQFVDDVTTAVGEISPARRSRAIILVPTYGQAGAIELLGRGRNLPPVYAVQNNYYLWGPPTDPVEAAIITGPFDERLVYASFNDVEWIGVHDCDWCMAWRDNVPIWLARDQRMPLHEIWPELKHYE